MLGMACWTAHAGLALGRCLFLGCVDIIARTTAPETARVAVLLVVLVLLCEATGDIAAGIG